MRNATQVWYDENLLPMISPETLPNEPVNQSQSPNAQSASQHRYEDILMAVLDCILNTVLLSLHHLVEYLISDLPTCYHGGPETPISRLSMADRLIISQSALAYVQTHSQLASKPLEFTTNLIRSYADRLPSQRLIQMEGEVVYT
jgi:hypothetical protein